MRPALLFLSFFVTIASPSLAVVNFTLSFTAQAATDFTSEEQALFQDGLDFWDNFIAGYRDGVSRDWNLEVDSFSEAADMGTVRLGSAGPSAAFQSGVVLGANTSNGRFVLSSGGSANFNTNPDAGSLNFAVVVHEIGHALGIGTLWELNEVYNNGIDDDLFRTLEGGTPGQYVGEAGLATFRTEFGQPDAAFIPVELDGGPGTAHGHWNTAADLPAGENLDFPDVDPGDNMPSPIVTSGNLAGRSLDDELLTGFISATPFLSATTLASLFDIGFTLVPESRHWGSLLGTVVIVFVLIQRRQFREDSNR